MKSLQMVFQNAAGKEISINIPEIKDDIDNEQVKTLMDLIIGKNIFETTGGDIIDRMDASIISKETLKLEVR